MLPKMISVAVYWVAVAGLQVICFQILTHGWSGEIAGVTALVIAFYSASLRSRIRLSASPATLALSPIVFVALLAWTVLVAPRSSHHSHPLVFLYLFWTILAVGVLAFVTDLTLTSKMKPNQSSDPALASGTSRAGHEPRHR
jgi:hypothetical protein